MGNHTMFVIGAAVIFFTAVLSLNRALVSNYNLITKNTMLLTSTSIAQEIIEEAQGKLFDESLSTDASPDIPVCFTAPESLGTESGESYPLFDDVDDYNELIKIVNTLSGKCSLSVKVGYVDSLNINQWINEKGFYKKMEVNVSNDANPHDVKLELLFCYFK